LRLEEKAEVAFSIGESLSVEVLGEGDSDLAGGLGEIFELLGREVGVLLEVLEDLLACGVDVLGV
jgi:hypothetical protein